MAPEEWNPELTSDLHIHLHTHTYVYPHTCMHTCKRIEIRYSKATYVSLATWQIFASDFRFEFKYSLTLQKLYWSLVFECSFLAILIQLLQNKDQCLDFGIKVKDNPPLAPFPKCFFPPWHHMTLATFTFQWPLLVISLFPSLEVHALLFFQRGLLNCDTQL